MLDKLIILLLIGFTVGVISYVITFKKFWKNIILGITGSLAGGIFSQILQIATSYNTPALVTPWVFSVSILLFEQIRILSKAFSIQLDLKTPSAGKAIKNTLPTAAA